MGLTDKFSTETLIEALYYWQFVWWLHLFSCFANKNAGKMQEFHGWEFVFL